MTTTPQFWYMVICALLLFSAALTFAVLVLDCFRDRLVPAGTVNFEERHRDALRDHTGGLLLFLGLGFIAGLGIAALGWWACSPH